MIDVVNEKMMPFRQVPKWCEKHIGKRIHPTTIHRWRIRGARGVKLDTILIGGQRFTSVETLLRFFAESTEAESPASASVTLDRHQQARVKAADIYLESEGI